MPGIYRLHNSLINVFWDYLPVPCSLILGKDLTWWHAMSIPQRGIHASYFELYFGRRQARWDYNARCVKKAAAAKKPVLGSHAGMQDLFIPVLDKGKYAACVILGSFQDRIPGRDLLWQQWKALRRGPQASEAEEFLMYCQARLELPVLDSATRAGLGKALARAGAALMGLADGDAVAAELDKFKVRQLSHALPWRMWHYAESRRDRLNFNQGPVEGAELAAWDAEEFGLKRAPDSAFALSLRDAASDEARNMALTAKLQAQAFEFCQAHPGLVAGRSGMQAALVLAACLKPLQARDLARQLHSALSKAMGLPLLCSWRSQAGKPLGLWQVIAAAEGGLRLGGLRGQDIFEAEPGAAGSAAHEQLEALGLELAANWAEGRGDLARLTQQKLCEAAVSLSAGRLDLLKLHLRWSLAALLQRLRRRGIQAGAIDERLEGSATARELAQRFSALSEDLGGMLRQGGSGRQLLQKSLKAITEHPESAASLAGLSADLGLSPSRLSRLLKSGSGVGFARARSQARLEKARRLLAESQIPVAGVAQECGWTSHAHFTRLFRRVEGLSPLAYRKKNQIQSQKKSIN